MWNTVAARKSVRYTGNVLLRGCGILEFKGTVYGYSLASYNLLLDNHYYLSGLGIAVTGRSSEIVESNKFLWDSYSIYMK